MVSCVFIVCTGKEMKSSVYWFVSCAVLNISYHVSGYVYKFVFVVHFPIKDVMLIKHMFSCSLTL